MDAFELTAAFNAAASAKTLLVGLALTSEAVDVETATRAARAEEDFQIAEWALVEGGHDVDQADIAVRLSAPRLHGQISCAWDRARSRDFFLGRQSKKI